MKKWQFHSWFLGFLSVLILAVMGCGGKITGIGVTPIPTLALRNQPTTTRQPILIQFCDDVTGSFPRSDFNGAAQLMASSLEQVVSANQNGVTLFATAINHNTADPANTLNPAFTVPPISAYPTPPTPVPTHAPANPVTDPATATAVAQQTTNSILTYNKAATSLDQVVQQTKAEVTQDVSRLTSWNPPQDHIATSIYGCFYLAASRFQGQNGIKMIYIASDLENNSNVDYTQNFVSAHSLDGVVVHVIYFVSSSASSDQKKRAMWCPYLKAAGASAVIFSDPTASPTLSDVFDKDMLVGNQPCQ